MKKYEPELVDLYNDFNKLYPNNQYLPFLQPGVNDIIGYQAKAKQQTASAVQFVDDYSKINSLDELLSRFKNETVYVDIWATWCKPCKEEFAYAPDLRTFLQSKSAKMLYLSTDVDERNDDWKKMAANYNLNGLHMRTTNKLREDLIKQLWDGKIYSIPRYLLIKNGQIVIADALRPSDKQKLYNQLSKFL